MILVSACARTPPPTAVPETLVIAGSSAMSPLLGPLADAYEQQHPSIAVAFEAYNTTRGVAQLDEGGAALAAVAGTPPEGLWSAPIAVEAIAVVVHADNPLTGLTLAQLHEVFSGRTWHWSELGSRLAEDEITVLSREEGSAVRAAFEAQVMAQGPNCRPLAAIELGSAPAERSSPAESSPCEPTPVTPTAILRLGSAAVIAYVAEHPSAIGYVAQGHLVGDARGETSRGETSRRETLRRETLRIKALLVEGVTPTPAHVAEGSYRLSLPLYLVAPEEPSGAARQFVDYCLSAKGQALVARHYVPARTR